MRLPIAALLLTLAACAAPATAAAELTVTETRQLTPRLSELTATTPSLDFPAKVRILLPDGYGEQPSRRYPVLYLLHGSFDTSASWTDKGAAEKLTAGLPVIVVMPPTTGKGDAGGWATDWRNEGRGGPPKWETFLIDELISWTDANLRTEPERGKRAIAGLSMGGFSTMSLAVRHPDLFTAAASFSGAVDTNYAPAWPIVQGEALADGGSTPDAIWGPRASDEVHWRAHNPWDLAANLRGMTLSIRSGNGQGEDGSTDPIEKGCYDMSLALHQRLDKLGIPHVWDDYGKGTHSWPYWQRDLELELPRIMAAFERSAAPAPARAFTHTAADAAFGVYGWDVDLRRPVTEFATLADASAEGFALRGSGEATVTTGPLYRAGGEYAVRVGNATRTLRADGAGRLRIDVPLGPGNPVQQFTPGATTKAFTTLVTIAGGACAGSAVRRVALGRGVRVRAVHVYTRGRRLARVRGSRRSLRVDLRGRPAGRYRLTVVVRGLRGARRVKLVSHRTLTVCPS